jgi:RES domain-containing protein
VSLSDALRAALDEVASAAKPFESDCFRSVELDYAHPDDVISGEGTRLPGGRFVPKGTRAVYASLDEDTATKEVTERKARLGGRAQIDLRAYPRLTYVIGVKTATCADLRSVDPSSALGRALTAALNSSGLEQSQELGKYLIAKGLQALLVPSAVCSGANIIVLLDANPSPKVEISNRENVIKGFQKLARHP